MKQEPRILLVCDRCDETEEFEMTALARDSWDSRNLQRASERAGWTWLGGDEHECPNCERCPDCALSIDDCVCCHTCLGCGVDTHTAYCECCTECGAGPDYCECEENDK